MFWFPLFRFSEPPNSSGVLFTKEIIVGLARHKKELEVGSSDFGPILYTNWGFSNTFKNCG